MDQSEPESETTPLPEEEGALPETNSPEELWTWVVIYSVCIFVTVMLNLVIIIGLVKRKNGLKKNELDVYLLSLVVSRTFIATFVIPARITGLFSEKYLGSLLCKICHYIGISSSATSIFSTSAVALLKLHEIVLKNMELKCLKLGPGLGVLIIWLAGYAYGVRTPFIYDLEFVEGGDLFVGNNIWMCTISHDFVSIGRHFLFVDLVFLFLLPASLITFCYTLIVLKLTRKTHQDGNGMIFQVNAKQNFLETRAKDLRMVVEKACIKHKERKVISMVLWVAVLFFVCSSLPYCLRLYLFGSGAELLMYRTLETTFYIISYSNAWINAVVLLFYRPDIRKTVVQVLRRRNRVTTSPERIVEKETTGLG